MIVNDLDLGLSHPWLAPRQGPGRGAEFDVTFLIIPWYAIGGQSANTIGAARYLVHQLEELASNEELQPLYVQWSASAASGAFNRADEHDGWYRLSDIQLNYRKFIVGGVVECQLTAQQHRSSAVPLGISWIGAARATDYTGAATPLAAFPVGSTGQPATTLSRAAAEGTVPLSAMATTALSPSSFSPGTIAQLHLGGVRVYDTVTAGSNAVPTDGTAAHATWVEVKGRGHDFTGDVIFSNGLLLLRFQIGQTACPKVYFWNTVLGTPAWQLHGEVQYQDVAANTGTLRALALEWVGRQSSRIVARANTTAGNWAKVTWELRAGDQYAIVDFEPRTESNTSRTGLQLSLQNAAKIYWNDAGIRDAGLQSSTAGITTLYGFAGGAGKTTNDPIFGWAYAAAPGAGQPASYTTTIMPFSDDNTLVAGHFKTYALWIVPFTTIANLFAEGESGTLDAGWSAVTTSGESGNSAAKCISGTVAARADIFGTSWQPPAGQYDGWFYAKVTSAAGSAQEMQIGIWDVTAAAFQNSVTFRANQLATSYGWIRAAQGFAPIAAHNYRFRCVTAATLGTDWFIDQAFLAPMASATLGRGSFPADIFSQFKYAARRQLVRG